MKNLLVIELNMGGHYGVYLRRIVRGALERDYRVFIGTFEDNQGHPLFKSILDEGQGTLEVITLPTPTTDYMSNTGTGGLLCRELAYRKLFRRFYHKTLQRARPDFVFLPFLDYCVYAIGLLGSPFGHTPWAGLAMRPAFHFKKMGIIGPRSLLLLPKQLLFLRMLQQKNFRALFTFDPSLYEYLKNKSSSCAEKVYYLRDPAEFEGDLRKEDARTLLQIPKEAVVILAYGTINYRKWVGILLSVAADPDFPSTVHILLAGQQGPDAERLLRSNLGERLMSSGRLHEINKFLADEVEYMVFKASDIAWLGYCGHYTMSGGILVQAGRMGLPAIACKEGLIGWFAKKYDIGVVIKNFNEKGIIEALQKLVANKVGHEEHINPLFSCLTVREYERIIFEAID